MQHNRSPNRKIENGYLKLIVIMKGDFSYENDV